MALNNKSNLRKPNIDKFGQELMLNLYDCSFEIITSKEKLIQYVDELCELIEMEKYGDTFVKRFTEPSPDKAGFSLTQIITTSLISGHFCDELRSAYINIFSCKDFDAEKAVEFTRNFFQAEKVITQLTER